MTVSYAFFISINTNSFFSLSLWVVFQKLIKSAILFPVDVLGLNPLWFSVKNPLVYATFSKIGKIDCSKTFVITGKISIGLVFSIAGFLLFSLFISISFANTQCSGIFLSYTHFFIMILNVKLCHFWVADVLTIHLESCQVPQLCYKKVSLFLSLYQSHIQLYLNIHLTVGMICFTATMSRICKFLNYFCHLVGLLNLCNLFDNIWFFYILGWTSGFYRISWILVSGLGSFSNSWNLQNFKLSVFLLFYSSLQYFL